MSRESVTRLAFFVSLTVSTQRPGDGCTRYYFHADPDSDGNPIGRAAGYAQAVAWLRGYEAHGKRVADRVKGGAA